ncbi:MAG: ABC transporter permease [Anaerolineae bacterium]|nr:ABC transporter permease [Anaerolineae bacterium]
MKRFGLEVKYLWLEQMLELRSYWHMYVGFSLIMPLMMVYGLSHIGGNPDDPQALIRLLVGTVIFAVANEGLCSMAIRVSTMRRDGTLVYYASLPISKVSFIVALILSRSLIVVPAIVAPLVIGPLMYGLSVQYGPGLLVILPLIALMLSAFGVLFGLLSPSVEIAQLGTNILLLILVLASPVFIAWDVLPAPLRAASLLLPFTYASNALNGVLMGDIGSTFWLNTAILTAMAALSLLVVARRLKWRLD